MNQNNIFKLKKNEFVIHLKHGLGKYQGLSIIKNNNITVEYLTILYANHAKLYVPITHLYLIKKYNTDIINTKLTLDTLGCKKWKKERKKIFKNIHDSAIQILENHAQRMIKTGFSFKKQDQEYKLFCSSFPFKMTKDQKKVMQEVLSDMYKPIPMDRLICGDVGFGKTEIAIRAAFIAVKNNKQVVILVPTTLLAQQHYKTFKNRFLKHNIQIELLSRFQKKSVQLMSINKINTGETDITIGTHKILFNNIQWFNLGLLIIDEEHRFGVHQKENIKKNFSNIDILTLTATPIPRTLNMAIHGMRDLSIITTPPQNRLPIKTFVKTYSNLLIRKIILFEISRHGQLYYICNKVQDLTEKLNVLQKMIPEATFQIGHGQMNGSLLKKIMYDFANKKFQVLICTTIIETGIDIPTVNTIIIENADFFGLAQLHQMRGRVGRSNIQAYAWLLIRNKKIVSVNSKKRLDVISNIKSFGSGFELSKHDLKIRGVGEVLGKNQSGHAKNIELLLYMEFLNKTVKYIKNNKHLSLKQLEHEQPEIKLSIPTILPKNYISDVNIRLMWYKKIFSMKTQEALLQTKIDLINAFGDLPKEAENLIFATKIKILSQNISIIKLNSDNKSSTIIFDANNKSINTIQLLKICKVEFKKWKFNNQHSLQFFYYFENYIERIQWIFNILKKIKKIFT
ncbi:Transcription-repair-coupling factor [Buchnera aphidicola (Takecallis arundicolens)]|uniref:DEAD/DEAH box helicase n=1 Tax=Buchnera aphidicola TaxID=9 RepID=UPI003464DAAF